MPRAASIDPSSSKRRQRNRKQSHRRVNRASLFESLEPRHLLAVTIDGMQLENDTGISSTDKITTDPTVNATVNGMFTGAYINVEFDHDADGTKEGHSTVNTSGESFTYNPLTYDASLSSYEGPLALKYRAVEFDLSGMPVATGSWSTFNLTLEQPSTAEIDVVDPWLVSLVDGNSTFDFGATPESTPVSHTFTIYNWGTESLAIDPASLSVPAGFSVLTSPAASVAPSGGSTTFSVQLDAITAGTYTGQLSFANDDFTENPFSFTVMGMVTGQAPEIEVRRADSTLIADGSGSVDFGATSQGTTVSQSFTIQNWGATALSIDTSSISVPSGYTVTALPAASVAPSGGQTTFTLRLDAAATGTYSGTVTLPNNDPDENPFDFSVTGIVGAAPVGVADFGLVSDTGNSATDLVTYDPRLSGKVSGNLSGGSVHVEFDHNGDTGVNGSVIVATSGDRFTYDPRTTDASLVDFVGSVPMKFRFVHYDIYGGIVETGSWTSFAFTMEAKPEAGGVTIDQFGLDRDTGASDKDRITIHPLLRAAVSGDFAGGSIQIQFDHNADGNANGNVAATATTDPLVYDPRATDPALVGYTGALTIYYRIAKFDGGGTLLATSVWSPFTFTLENPPASDYAVSIGLANDTGTSTTDKITYDGTLTGTVTADELVSIARVEFDTNNDGTPDETAYLYEGPTYVHTPEYTAYGSTTVQVRALEWNRDYATYLKSPWTPLTFTLDPQASMAVTELGLAYDDGDDTDDNISSLATLTGQIDRDTGHAVENVKIELDLSGDSVPDATTWTNASGGFVYQPTGLTAGASTVKARSARWDYILDQEVAGAWTSLTFTYQPQTPPAVEQLVLDNDDGTDPADNKSSDPTVRGRLARDEEQNRSVVGVEIELDTNNDGTVDGRTVTDVFGSFRYRPVGLATGAVTVKARAAEWDALNRTTTTGAWTTLAYTLETATTEPTLVLTIGLVEDDGSSDSDNQSTNPVVKGQIGNDDGLVAYQVVEFDHNADGVFEGTALTDDKGSFTYVPIGLGYGQATIKARARQWDYNTSQGTYSPWLSVDYIYLQAVNDPPEVSQLKLASDTGPSATDGLTANTTLTGQTTNDTPLADLTIEFDHDADGVADGWAFTDADGRFSYAPVAPIPGAMTIAARAVEWNFETNTQLTGAWQSLSFTYELQADTAPSLVDLALANDTGSSGTDNVTSDPTVAGRILNEGPLGGVTIEFDLDGDGTVDQSATTDAYGEFSFTPVGLPTGAVTVNMRSRELDAVAGTYLVSGWSPISFTLEAATNTAASVATLALQNDTGSSSTDQLTWDATVSGQITNDGDVAGLEIQFDTNGDGVVDGSALADDDGNFTYAPAGLEPGAATINARVREPVPSGLPLYSGWTSLAITVEEEPDTSVRVTSVILKNDTGNSSTDGASADATVEGQITGGAGIKIELDLDGDGLSDAEATTDSTGKFTYTPESPTDGVTTVSARTVENEDSYFVRYGGWQSVSFVYSTDPDGTAAQSLVSAMNTYKSDWQTAESTYDSSVSSAELAYQQARDAAVTAYDNALATAGGGHQATVDAAEAAYRTAIAAADQNYVNAISDAGAAFQTNLAAFAGDTTSFQLDDFAWPDAPPSGALVVPDDDTRPAAPGSHLVGLRIDELPWYDFQSDALYQAAAAQGLADYRALLRVADDAYDQSQVSAETVYRQSIATATVAYNAAVVAKVKAVRDAPPATPPVDLDAEYQAHSQAVQGATDTYHSDVETHRLTHEATIASAYTTMMSSLATADTAYNARTQAAADELALYSPYDPEYYTIHYPAFLSSLANSEVLYATDKAVAHKTHGDVGVAAAQTRAQADALSLRTRDEAIHAAEKTLTDKIAELEDWRRGEALGDTLEIDQEKATVEHDRAQATAAARQVYDDDMAAARATRSAAVVTASTGYTQALAGARHAALSGYATFVASPWAQYQQTLAASEIDQLDVLVPKIVAHRTAVAAENQELDEAVSLEVKNRASALAVARRTQNQGYAQENHDYGITSSQHTRTRAVENNTLWKTEQDGFTLADYTFSMDTAGAAATGGNDQNVGIHTLEIALGQAQADFLLSDSQNQAQKDADIAAAWTTWNDTDADIFHTFTYASIDAEDLQFNSKQDAITAYVVGHHEAERVMLGGVADAGELRENNVAGLDGAQYQATQTANGTLMSRTREAERDNAYAVGLLDKNHAVEQSTEARVRAVADTEALSVFREAVADERVAQVSAWRAILATPWSDYQEDQAEAQKTHATGLRAALLEYVTAVAGAIETWLNDQADDAKALVEKIFDAAWNEMVDVAADLIDYAVDVVVAEILFVGAVASETTSHDKDVVGHNKTYRDAEAAEQETLNKAIRAANSAKAKTMADAARDLAKGTIDQATYDQREATADATERAAIADANVDRANNVALAWKTWVGNIGDENVEWVTDVGTAADALATALKLASDDFATDESDESQDYTDTVASAVETGDIAAVGDDAVLGGSLAAADAQLNKRLATADSQATSDVGAARGLYEKTLYADHSTARAAVAASSGTILAQYQADHAAADAVWSEEREASFNSFYASRKLASENTADAAGAADVALESATSSAVVTAAPTAAGAAKDFTTAFGAAFDELGVDWHKALTGQFVGVVDVETNYARNKALADKAYGDQVALAHQTWVGTVADKTRDLFLGTISQASWDAALAGANVVRTVSEGVAIVLRVGAIGDAQITRAGGLGETDVVAATAVGVAGKTHTGKLNVADTDLLTAAQVVELQILAAVVAATTGHASGVGGAVAGLIAALGTAEVALHAGLGDSDVTRRTSTATAEGDYQTAGSAADSTALGARATATGTAEHQFKAAAGSAFASWIAGVASDYVTYRAAEARQVADRIDADVESAADAASEVAVADSQFISDATALGGTLETDGQAAVHGYETGLVARENTLLSNLADADKTQLVGYAEAWKAYVILVAEAEKTYQIALVNNDASAESDKTTALAGAKAGRITDEANADLVWVNLAAMAATTYATGQATGGKDLVTGLAAAETAYATGVAQESAELETALTAVDTGLLADEIAADSALDSAGAASHSAWWSAGDAQQATSLGTFATSMNNTPWATYRKDRAVAERDWWTAQAPNYLARFADRAVPQSTYQTAATTAAGARTTAQNSADQAGVANVAGAVETRSGDVSTAYKDYATVHAVAVEDYRTAVALAERNRTVALAQAQAALDSGGSQSEYDTAAAAAETAYAGAMKTAADDYAVSEAGERGTRDVAVASAGVSFATTAGTAEVTWVTATFTAEETFVGAEGNAHATRVAEIANIDAAYLGQEASSYTAAYDALESANGTPWATFDSDRATASGDWLTTVSLEQAILAIARANADRDLDLARATAEKDLAIALTQASSDEWLALVTADLAQVTAESSANQALAATAGWTGLLRADGPTTSGGQASHHSVPKKVIAPDRGGGQETLEGATRVEDYSLPPQPSADEDNATQVKATVDLLEKAKGGPSIDDHRKRSNESSDHGAGGNDKRRTDAGVVGPIWGKRQDWDYLVAVMLIINEHPDYSTEELAKQLWDKGIEHRKERALEMIRAAKEIMERLGNAPVYYKKLSEADRYILDAWRKEVWGDDPQEHPFFRIREAMEQGHTVVIELNYLPSQHPVEYSVYPTPPVPDDECSALDRVQIGLDIVGCAPVVGELADVLNGFISLGRGDYLGAGLSFIAIVPIVGDAIGKGGKVVRFGVKYVDEVAVGARGSLVAPNRVLSSIGSAGAPALTAADFAKSPALRRRIIDELRNTTSKADEIADLLEEGKVGLNFLSDEMFDYLGYSGRNAVYNPATRQIYLRRSDPNFFSTIVHEGVHALDHAAKALRPLFNLELRAHLFQRQYEIFVNGFSARYPTIKSAWDRILRDYASPFLHTIFKWPN